MLARLLGILCLLLLASSCNRQDLVRREILKVLAARSTALNSRNLSQYISIVSPKYNDKGKNLAQLKENLGENFKNFSQFSYEADKPSITVSGNSAESAGSYRMKFKLRGKEMAFNGTEHIKLAKEPDGWKIIAGI